MSSLRARLEAHLGQPLRPSTRLEWGDLVGRLASTQETPWARCWEQAGCLQVRYLDPVLIGLGCWGQQGRAGLAAELTRCLQARAGEVIEADFRPLWLALESLQHRPNQRLRDHTQQRLDRLYESDPLAGQAQAQRGYPRLAQWALLAGALERIAKGLADPATNSPRSMGA